jgi:uncharacterized protein (DUF433 family)
MEIWRQTNSTASRNCGSRKQSGDETKCVPAKSKRFLARKPFAKYAMLLSDKKVNPPTLASATFTLYHHDMRYQDIITIEPGKRSGKPCIRGMRITVYDVLEYLASDMTQEEILQDFPYLTKEDILACFSYAADREKRLMVVEA